MSRFGHSGKKKRKEKTQEPKGEVEGRNGEKRVRKKEKGRRRERKVTEKKKRKERKEKKEIANFIKEKSFKGRFSIRDRIKPKIN